MSVDLEVRRHNEQLLEELEVGDLIQFPRGVYSHWAVYIGEGEVVHLAGEEDDGLNSKMTNHLYTISGQQVQKAFVKIDKFLNVAGESKAIRNNSKDKKFKPLPPDQIVGNALTKLGQVGYNLLYQNCEHFASWCRYGLGKSDQVDTILGGLSLFTAIGTTLGLLIGLARGARFVSRRKNPGES